MTNGGKRIRWHMLREHAVTVCTAMHHPLTAQVAVFFNQCEIYFWLLKGIEWMNSTPTYTIRTQLFLFSILFYSTKLIKSTHFRLIIGINGKQHCVAAVVIFTFFSATWYTLFSLLFAYIYVRARTLNLFRIETISLCEAANNRIRPIQLKVDRITHSSDEWWWKWFSLLRKNSNLLAEIHKWICWIWKKPFYMCATTCVCVLVFYWFRRTVFVFHLINRNKKHCKIVCLHVYLFLLTRRIVAWNVYYTTVGK